MSASIHALFSTLLLSHTSIRLWMLHGIRSQRNHWIIHSPFTKRCLHRSHRHRVGGVNDPREVSGRVAEVTFKDGGCHPPRPTSWAGCLGPSHLSAAVVRFSRTDACRFIFGSGRVVRGVGPDLCGHQRWNQSSFLFFFVWLRSVHPPSHLNGWHGFC